MEAEKDPWRKQLSDNIDRVEGEEVRRKVIPMDVDDEACHTVNENIAWTRECMKRLDRLVDEDSRRDILTGCAHTMPESRIAKLRDFYQETKDIDALMRFWQEDFLKNLKNRDPHEDWLKLIIDQGWGEVGMRVGRTVYATKIPADMEAYFDAEDDVEMKRAYCHCQRVRDCIGFTDMSPTYCYCGAGFYKANWERILGRPVDVFVLRSVMQGDDVCRFAIHVGSE